MVGRTRCFAQCLEKMPRPIKASSRLRELRPTHLSQLCLMLDPLNLWQDLAANIKNRHGAAMFNMDQVINIGLHTAQSGKSATRELITSWCTDNPTVGDLQDILVQIRAYRAADYLSVQVFNQHPVQKLQPPKSSNETEDSSKSVKQQNNMSSEVDSTVAKQHHSSYDTGQSNDSLVHKCGYIPSSSFTESSVYGVDSCCSTEPVRGLDQQTSQQGCVRLSYELLRQGTNNFDSQPVSNGGNLLGEGGFGQVFKAILPNYPVMAVKKFNISLYDDNPLARKQFTTEISVLSRCNHENLLPLVGFSDDSPLCVIYEYMSNGSLEDCLALKHGGPSLPVPTRLDIIKGVARGLNYLHNLNPVLIHRDIKSANILLNEHFIAKIGDCGTVREGPRTTKTFTVTQAPIGTCPYMAREYVEENEISVRMDAYSYGVVLLEVITGLPVNDPDREDSLLPTHVRENTEKDEDIMSLLDHSAGNWGTPLPIHIYKMANKFMEYKLRRPTIAEVLPEIETLHV